MVPPPNFRVFLLGLKVEFIRSESLLNGEYKILICVFQCHDFEVYASKKNFQIILVVLSMIIVSPTDCPFTL